MFSLSLAVWCYMLTLQCGHWLRIPVAMRVLPLHKQPTIKASVFHCYASPTAGALRRVTPGPQTVWTTSATDPHCCLMLTQTKFVSRIWGSSPLKSQPDISVWTQFCLSLCWCYHGAGSQHSVNSVGFVAGKAHFCKLFFWVICLYSCEENTE